MTQPIKNILPKLIKSLKRQLPHRHSTACLALALCQVQWNLAESDCLVKSVFLSVVLSLMDALFCAGLKTAIPQSKCAGCKPENKTQSGLLSLVLHTQ